jgi:RHS repeat-associated protein
MFVQTIYAPWAPFGPNFALSFGQAVQAAHLVLPGGAYAQYGDNAPLNDVNTYWHPDWLGTPRLYSTTTRTMSQDVAYAPFGEQYVGPAVDAFFTGAAESIGANDIKLFPARLYERTAGRWLTPDPAGLAAMDLTNPQSLNRYGYVLGNPLANVDPSGTGACGPGFALTYDPQCQLGPWAQFGSSISAVRSFDPFRFLNSGLTDEQNGTLNSGSFFAGASIASLGSSGLPGGNGGMLFGPSALTGVPPSSRTQNVCSVPPLPGRDANAQIQSMIGELNNIDYAGQSAKATLFSLNFWPGHAWDYKSQYPRGDVQSVTQARIFGNFAFGAVMRAGGLSYYEAQNAAGAAQIIFHIIGKGAPGQGTPLLRYPYGDQVQDALDIERGYNYVKALQTGVCH